MQVIDIMYDSLGRINPYTYELEPWIAAGWEIDPDDDSIVTVTLRTDVKWHDGSMVTIEDVEYTFGSGGYNIAYIDYYARNQFRIPDYFRIDLSLNIEGNLKADKLMHSTWSINVYNLLGRNNPQSIYFKPHEFFIQGYAFSVIGAPVFTLSWNVKLGNYESQ